MFIIRGIYRLPRAADHPVDTTADRFTSTECHKASNELGLRRRQARFCFHSRFGYAMLAVLRAAHAVGYHCPRAFADRRWNCTSIHRLPEVSPELRRGTREQALVHSFSSAALLFEIARYCALNKIRFCSCGDEDMAFSRPAYRFTQNPPGQVAYFDSGGALVYESGMNNGFTEQTSNVQATQMTEGQPTVSRFYWAGCSDNLRVAREYASAFLGFPNVRILRTADANAHKRRMLDTESNRHERQPRSTNYLGRENQDQSEDEELRAKESHMQFRKMPRGLQQHWSYPTADASAQHPINYRPHQTSQLRSPRRQSLPYQSRRWLRRPPTSGRRKQSPITRIMDRHNYLAGVVLMEVNHKTVCKCHGVSGSCAQRVCFHQLRRIDDEVMQKALKVRYLAAKQVTLDSNRRLVAKTFTGAGFADEVVDPSELVFSEHSPDYCNYEPQRGSVGTYGRLCSLEDAGTANCLNMCCGRGYKNITAQETVQCNCRMGEGFKVNCDECRIEVMTYRCL
ncbi:unnamed protein product [Dicrocoelium dendriticum]|nr:unnamed protein product [Dicrocoelium dendriticum]